MSAAPSTKTLPHSKEAEMLVLGCMLTNTNALNKIACMLSDQDFYYTKHRILFQFLKEAYKKNIQSDVNFFAEELKRIDKLDAIGGEDYLKTLSKYPGTSKHAEEYSGTGTGVRNRNRNRGQA